MSVFAGAKKQEPKKTPRKEDEKRKKRENYDKR